MKRPPAVSGAAIGRGFETTRTRARCWAKRGCGAAGTCASSGPRPGLERKSLSLTGQGRDSSASGWMGASSPRLRLRCHRLRLRRLRFRPHHRRLLPLRCSRLRSHRHLRPRPDHRRLLRPRRLRLRLRRHLLRLRRLRLRHRPRPCRPFPRKRPASPTRAQERKFRTTARTPGYASLRDEIEQRYSFVQVPFMRRLREHLNKEDYSPNSLPAPLSGQRRSRGAGAQLFEGGGAPY